MSWQETQEKEKTLNEQFELLQQDMDRLMLAQSQLYENIEKNTNVLTQETRKAQQAVVSALTAELEKTFKEREKKTVLVKKWLELAFYGVLAIIIYQALTTSLWQTLGFQELYKQVHQFKYGGLVVTVVYTLLNILALVWLVKKLVKSWRY